MNISFVWLLSRELKKEHMFPLKKNDKFTHNSHNSAFG